MSIGGTFNNKAGLEKGEVVLKESRAHLQTDFMISQEGRLFLTNKRFIFLPARFSIPLSAQKAEDIILDLARINVAEKRKGDTSNLLAGSLRSRLYIQCNEKSYIFQIGGIDEWIRSIKEVIGKTP
jgi:hypothetical protein